MKSHYLLKVFAVLVMASLLWQSAWATDSRENFDLQGFIDQKIRAGDKTIIIPPGRYYIRPKNKVHLRLANLNNIEIIATGVEMICTETTQALSVENCRQVTIRGLTIDYDPLPYTQGKITGISPDKQVLTVELFDGYPRASSINAEKFELFRPDTRTLRFGSYYDFRCEILSAKQVKIIKDEAYGKSYMGEVVGDLAVITSSYAPGGSIAHALHLNQCQGVILEDVTIYSANCFSFFETTCDGTIYRRCVVDRRPAKTDFVRRAEPRLMSGDWDAFHSKYAIKGPSYLECSARWQGDDCIAINGDYHLVISGAGSTLRVLAKGGMAIRPGTPLELLGFDGIRLPDAEVVSVEKAGPQTPEEQKLVAEMEWLKPSTRKSGLKQGYTITLDRPVNLKPGSLIASANALGNGFLIQGGNFGFNRSRGFVIKASNGKVAGATLEGCWMQAILLEPDGFWLEAGSSSDVEISNNILRNNLSVGIEVSARSGSGRVVEAGAHRNINIIGNQIANNPAPAIRLTSTDGGRIDGNRITLSPESMSNSKGKSLGVASRQAVVCLKNKNITGADVENSTQAKQHNE